MSQARRSSNQHRPSVDREGPSGLRFGMFATCVIRDGNDDIRGKPKELYTVLVTFADTEGRDTDKGYPYRTVLAKALGCSTKTVDRATDALEEIGLVTVHSRKLPGGTENDANRYELHDGWLIHGMEPSRRVPARLVARYGHHIRGFDVAAFLEGGGDMGVPTPGDMGVATGGDMGVAQSRAGSPEPSSTDGDAPSARSAPDGRRPPVGSRGRAGGSAASGKSPSPSLPSLTPAQGKLVAAVLRELPYGLTEALPARLPRHVKHAVLEALAPVDSPLERSPEQLVKYRVMPKWWGFYSGEQDEGRLGRPVGAFLRMLRRDQECGNPRCDERVDVDTGYGCEFCATAREDRAQARQAARAEERAAEAAERAEDERERPEPPRRDAVPSQARQEPAPAPPEPDPAPARAEPRPPAVPAQQPGPAPAPDDADPWPAPDPEAVHQRADGIRAHLRDIKPGRIRRENHRWRDRDAALEPAATAPF